MSLPDDARKIECRGAAWLVRPCGEVWRGESISRTTRTRAGKNQSFESVSPPKRLAPWMEKTGYLAVQYRLNGKRHRTHVHRLVALAFVPGHFEGATVNHINGKKTDNRPENLEWVSLAQNTVHQWESGLVDLRGEANPNSKLTSRKVRILRRLMRLGASCNELAVLCDMSPSLMVLIRDGQRWRDIATPIMRPSSTDRS